MTFTERVRRRFAGRLAREPEGLSAWEWVAILGAAFCGLMAFYGFVMAFELDDYLMFTWAGLLLGTFWLAVTSPGWGTARAIRRHRRRVTTRQVRLMPLRQAADDMFARGSIDKPEHRAQRDRIDPLLQGVGPGDLDRVSASFLRFVAGWAIAAGSLIVLAGASLAIEVGPGDELFAPSSTVSLVGLVMLGSGIGFTILAGALAKAAAQKYETARREAETAHDALLESARR